MIVEKVLAVPGTPGVSAPPGAGDPPPPIVTTYSPGEIDTGTKLSAVGEGPPDFVPSQWEHSAEQHDSYMDWETTFDNLYEWGKDKKK